MKREREKEIQGGSEREEEDNKENTFIMNYHRVILEFHITSV